MALILIAGRFIMQTSTFEGQTPAERSRESYRLKYRSGSGSRNFIFNGGWASSSDGLDVDGVDFKPASDVIIQDQQTLYSFWCTM